MKLKIFATESRGFKVVKAVAVITKPARRQKTFVLRTVAPNFAVTEMQKAFEAAAARWECATLSAFQQKQAGHGDVLVDGQEQEVFV